VADQAVTGLALVRRLVDFRRAALESVGVEQIIDAVQAGRGGELNAEI
jgi:hypothetical protein